MALSGRLESIPLPEVLRLLARAGKTGCLRVEAGQMEGKLYLADGELTYSTTRRDDDLRADLLNAGFVTADQWLLVERRERDLLDVLQPGRTVGELRDFLAEQGTEVVFRLQRPGRGTFDFADDERPRYESGQSVDIEKALAEAERRVAEWAEIEEVIPSTKHRLRMASSLPEGARDVTVTAPTWRLLSALGGQGTVEDVAERIGSSDFVVAQALASMVRSGLVELSETLASARYSYNATDYGHENAAEASDDEETNEEEPDETELLGGLLSSIESDEKESDVQILDSSYDASFEVEGSLSERAAAMREANELRALANELTDLSE